MPTPHARELKPSAHTKSKNHHSFLCHGGFKAAKQLCNGYCSKKQQEPRSRALRMLGKALPEKSPDLGGLQILDGLVVPSCTSHPRVLGSIPKRKELGKTGAPCVKVPGSSRVPLPPHEQLVIGTVLLNNNNIYPFNNHHRTERWMGGLILVTSFNISTALTHLDVQKVLKVLLRSLPRCSKLGISERSTVSNSQKFSFTMAKSPQEFGQSD